MGYPAGKVADWSQNPQIEGFAAYCVANGCKRQGHWHYRNFRFDELPEVPDLTWAELCPVLKCEACGTKGDVNVIPRWRQAKMGTKT